MSLGFLHKKNLIVLSVFALAMLMGFSLYYFYNQYSKTHLANGNKAGSKIISDDELLTNKYTPGNNSQVLYHIFKVGDKEYKQTDAKIVTIINRGETFEVQFTDKTPGTITITSGTIVSKAYYAINPQTNKRISMYTKSASKEDLDSLSSGSLISVTFVKKSIPTGEPIVPSELIILEPNN